MIATFSGKTVTARTDTKGDAYADFELICLALMNEMKLEPSDLQEALNDAVEIYKTLEAHAFEMDPESIDCIINELEEIRNERK